MKKIIYLYLIFFAFPSLSQTQIGFGSYSTNFPGTDVAGRNGFPSGAPQLSGSALSNQFPLMTGGQSWLKKIMPITYLIIH